MTLDRSALNQLMVRASQGDRDAVPQVYRALWPIVRQLCVRMVGPASAEDAAQKALIKLFQSATSFDVAGDVTAWSLTLAAWECRTLRRRKRDTVSPDSAPLSSDSPSPEETVMQRELMQHAAELLSGLSPADQETLRAAFSDDAGAVLASVAFRKRKQRALERLRALWRRSPHA